MFTTPWKSLSLITIEAEVIVPKVHLDGSLIEKLIVSLFSIVASSVIVNVTDSTVSPGANVNVPGLPNVKSELNIAEPPVSAKVTEVTSVVAALKCTLTVLVPLPSLVL